MFKFLRKYNKWILAVGGTLLMIVFLGGQALQGLFESAGAGSATFATLKNGRSVKASEWNRVQAEVGFLRDIGLVMPFVGRITQPEHWFLLSLEAEEAGLVGGPGAIEITPDQLVQLSMMTRQSPQFIAETYAKVRGVESLIRGYRSAGKQSDRRLRNFARHTLFGMQADLVVIKADGDASNHQPTEAELREQFEKYRGQMPGQGEMGFGYKFENRVRLEWLTIPRATVRDAMLKSDRYSRVSQLKHWQRFGGTRGLPAYDSSVTVIPQAVSDDLLDSLTEETLNAIVKFAHDQARSRQIALPEEDGYYVLPEDWTSRQMSFTALAQAVQDRFSIATPVYQSAGEWLDSMGLARLEGIGLAQAKQASGLARLATLVGAAKEFTDKPEFPDIQTGIVGPPLRAVQGESGDGYLFRIVETDRSREPISLDEVRDKVVSDVRLLREYEALVALMPEMKKIAAEQGMLALAMKYDTTIQPPQNLTLCDLNLLMQFVQSGWGARAIPSSLPIIGSDEEALELLLEQAMKLPENTMVATLPESQRVIAAPSKKGLAVVVARVTALRPVTEESYSRLAGGVAMALQEMIVADEIKVSETEQFLEAFGFDAMAKRHGFAFSSPRTKDEDDTGEEPGLSTTATASAG